MYYKDQLKDPRWQRTSARIKERDDWTCQYCGSTTVCLNVHHIKYSESGAPWDVPDEWLITFCEKCHEIETNLGRQNPTLALHSKRIAKPVLFMLEVCTRMVFKNERASIKKFRENGQLLFTSKATANGKV